MLPFPSADWQLWRKNRKELGMQKNKNINVFPFSLCWLFFSFPTLTTFNRKLRVIINVVLATPGCRCGRCTLAELLGMIHAYTGCEKGSSVYNLVIALFVPDRLISDRPWTVYKLTFQFQSHIQFNSWNIPHFPSLLEPRVPLETMLTHRVQEGKSGDETGSCSTSLYFQPW